MKIMKVVYSQENNEIRSFDVSASYMGEESWTVGENFNGEFVKGKVTDIYLYQSRGVELHVNGVYALFIPLHAVQRIYYGAG